MSFNTTDITNGVSISGSTNPFNTYIKTENAGVYDIQFSAQVDKTDSGTDEIWIWLRKNGTNLTDTATSVQLDGNGAHYVAAWNFFVNSSANDYYQLMWYSPDANVRLHAEPGFGVVPGIPSVIATVNRVDQFLSNTGSFSGSFNGNFTGSLFGTSSYATNALTASYVLNAVSASFATTSSYADNFIVRNYLFIDSASLDFQQNTNVTTGSYQVVLSVATGSFRCAFFDYVTFSGSISRAGTVYTVWSGSTTEFTETSTSDIGGSTAIVDLRTAISGSNIQLQSGISGSAWSVRSLVRLL
jgi:hypothetical protein